MDPKPIYTSVTLYGALLTAIGMILKSFGIDIGDQVSALQKLLPDILSAVGIIVVIIGRLRPGAGAPVTKAQASQQAIAPLMMRKGRP